MSEQQHDSDELGHRLAHAIADRRREPARGFEERLRAAAMRPARMRWLIPALAATAVAVMAIVVALVWRGRTDDEARFAELPRLELPRPTPPPVVEDPPVAPAPEPPLPAGPLARPGAIDVFAEYQTIIDGDTSGVGLDAAQASRVKRIVDDHKRVLIKHLDEQIRGHADLQAEWERSTPDTGVILAAYDRVLAAESAARRAAVVARIAIREVLTPAQRKLVEGRVVSSRPIPPPTPPARPVPAPGDTHTMKVVTQPPGADVIVDGVARGLSPVVVRLEPGRHEVIVRLKGYETVARTVELREDTTQRYMLQEAPAPVGHGTLRVTARPPAEVSVDGRLVGTTPLVVDLAPGRHRVVARFADGSAESRVIDIRDGVRSALSLSRPPATGSQGSAGGIKNPFDDGF